MVGHKSNRCSRTARAFNFQIGPVHGDRHTHAKAFPVPANRLRVSVGGLSIPSAGCVGAQNLQEARWDQLSKVDQNAKFGTPGCC
ncbi:hypothetical protein Pnap_2498 [Polaromonas naphthalenivorans CJ2]|uniref:Uncharacterized protein n=1 Tax=Polaromonas naphthalenivorans (strain CJ2) TaxID=365044 RepID=A1VQ74_POLNA|nr:hypothetical protein Pnap_2498 [Polaromonas naphthalenivorans CJ2]